MASRRQPIPSKQTKSFNIDEHVELIKGQVKKSLLDPESRQLAVKIVSNKVTWKRIPGQRDEAPFVQAWGAWYEMEPSKMCPPRQDECEIEAVWNFMVKNCRYVFDIEKVDTFLTLQYTLESGGADCDDCTIAFATLLRAIGFAVTARVISTTDDPGSWSHIYPMVGLPKDNPTKWMPLDITVTGAVPGWQYEHIAAYRDYQL